MSDTLLPCPFCGVAPLFVKHDRWPTGVVIRCAHDHGCQITPTTRLLEFEAAAIAAWNRRAPVAEPPQDGGADGSDAECANPAMLTDAEIVAQVRSGTARLVSRAAPSEAVTDAELLAVMDHEATLLRLCGVEVSDGASEALGASRRRLLVALRALSAGQRPSDLGNVPGVDASAHQVREARELLQDWIDGTDWDGADPHEGERANAVAILLQLVPAAPAPGAPQPETGP